MGVEKILLLLALIEWVSSVHGVCNHRGIVFAEGSVWRTNDCHECKCNGSIPSCTATNCGDPRCDGSEEDGNITAGTDLCCSECSKRRNVCKYKEKLIEEATEWNTLHCEQCRCNDGTVSCTNQECPYANCPRSELSILTTARCCPHCIAGGQACINEGEIYQNGERLPGSSCMPCFCKGGALTCYIARCSSVVCNQGEALQTLPGKCCPQCVKRHCDNGGKVYQMGVCCPECTYHFSPCTVGNVTHKSGTMWEEDQCTLCGCEDGKIECFVEKCPVCEYGAIAVKELGKCCPLCEKRTCAPECRTCLSDDMNSCTECSDMNHVLQDGGCRNTCIPGYYKNEKKFCLSCHSNCDTCFGGLHSQCLSCKEGFLLKRGQCVRDCGFNSFQSGEQCLECHPSCSQCSGPREDQCLSCEHPGLVLDNGRCSDYCSGHSYAVEGNCLACNTTCARCLKDGICQICMEGYFLEEGYCVPDCSLNNYVFLDAYCLPCHERCIRCDGPLPSQCKSCPLYKFLLNGICVSGCGEGYYADEGGGICRKCHPSCRTCVGSSASDKCLSCSSGYFLPKRGAQFGNCVETCPSDHYLTDTGICEACHERCKSCFGPDIGNCRSCSKPLHLENGKCVRSCPENYRLEDNVCRACHASCASCHGMENVECSDCVRGAGQTPEHCTSVCQLDEFMDSQGSCKRCQPTCSKCVVDATGISSVCIECKHQEYVILADQCVEHCGSHFFINAFRECEECHSSCATCEKGGLTGCASCHEGYVLSHLGTCVQNCFLGHYDKDGICLDCDDKCFHCKNEGRCELCKGQLLLQFYGECAVKCPEYQFINHNRACTDCSEKCNTCHGPSSKDCTSCKENKLLERGICVESCSDGYCQDGKDCIACNPNCKTCSSFSTCTSCYESFMLLDGECITGCGRGKYSNFEDRICEDCPENCVDCFTPEKCELCESGFYLHNEMCEDQCPEGYFGDPYKRMCEKNIHAPELLIDGTLSVVVKARVPVSTSLLNVTDEDTEWQNLFFVVVDTPQNGMLLIVSDDGKETILEAGDNFTKQHLMDGWIFFNHRRGIPLSGDLLIKASDRQLESPPSVVPIEVVSHHPPSLEQKEMFIVYDGEVRPITTEVLQISDWDNFEDISIQILEGPHYGKLVLLPLENEIINGIQASEFSEETIAYKHLGKSVKQDKLILQISDGYNSRLAALNIFILKKGATGPIIVKNNPATVKIGSPFKLTNQNLLVIANESKAKDIVFDLHPSIHNPLGGELLKVPEYFAMPGYKMISRGNGFERISSFTQEDINQGRIIYQHLNLSIEKTLLKFQVRSLKDPSVQLKGQTFQFHVATPGNELSKTLPSKKFDITVSEYQPTTIDSSHLSVQSDEISSSEIHYIITKHIEKVLGSIEHTDHLGDLLKSFSQEDVDNLKIIYIPPSEKKSMQTEFSFHFIVSDARSGSQLYPEEAFTIRVKPNTNSLSHHESHIVINQGQKIILPSHVLSTAGHQIPEDELEVVLDEVPTHGRLFLENSDGSDGKFEMGAGEAFGFTDLINNMLYEHDGSPNFNDSAVFTIQGGKHSSKTILHIDVIAADKESPVILDSASLTASVTEGKVINIQKHQLAYTDSVSQDADITFTLLQDPKYGHLEKCRNGSCVILKKKDKFSQQDVNDLFIRYSAADGTGPRVVSDSLFLNVTDKSGNVQPGQELTIKIKPRNRFPPRVSVKEDIQVEEGGYSVLGNSLMSVTDQDSNVIDLVVEIDKQPEHGYLENSRPNPGLEHTFDGIPVGFFPFVDISQGFIKYRQHSHSSIEPVWDSFQFHISDGHLSSTIHQINITIKPVNDEAPVVFAAPIIVEQSGWVIIRNSSLSVIDADTNPVDLVITLNTLPKQGVIMKLQKANEFFNKRKVLTKEITFTFQDVLSDLIVFFHNNAKRIRNDSFSVNVSDGLHSVTTTLHVIVTAADKETPFLAINRGLQLQAGTSGVINSKLLRAVDTDSKDEKITFVLLTDPADGHLTLIRNKKVVRLSARGSVNDFTQVDLNQEFLKYVHSNVEPKGMQSFKFNVQDDAGNVLLNQKFIITIRDDVIPPSVINNTGINVNEGSAQAITSKELGAIDPESNSSILTFFITKKPEEGQLEFLSNPGKRITQFLQSDLTSKNIRYVHTSKSGNLLDSFTFKVSDGKNSSEQTFYINITAVNDDLPYVRLSALRVPKGENKIISEFELKIVDSDTKDSEVIVNILAAPEHGSLILRGSDADNFGIEKFFTKDVYDGKVYYQHDGSDSRHDSFSFTVFDGANSQFVVLQPNENVTFFEPVVFPIEILPSEDGSPVLKINKGLQLLTEKEGKNMNAINSKVLFTEDADTEPGLILYTVIEQPKQGYLELLSKPGRKLNYFSQKDIDSGLLQYILSDENSQSTSDQFIFNVQDTKPNILETNRFSIQWTRINFSAAVFKEAEAEKIARISVRRYGNLNLYSTVHCKTKTMPYLNNRATVKEDFEVFSSQIQFEEGEEEKYCFFKIHDDPIFEGEESFDVFLSTPFNAILGTPMTATISIHDDDDEPVISFKENYFYVNETQNYLYAPVLREGDLSQHLTTICYTSSLTARGSSFGGLETGSDFRSRSPSDISQIIFQPGASSTTCNVMILDDSLYEEAEEFELFLSEPFPKGRIGSISKASVIINGPNDQPQINLVGNYFEFAEEIGEIKLQLIRIGPDLSKLSTVLCSTRPSDTPSAIPDEDYLSTSVQITFNPHQNSAECSIVILDDDLLEENETFVVYLNTASRCSLGEFSTATVKIYDGKSDVPCIQFAISNIMVNETSGEIPILLRRTGDISQTSTVRCVTRQDTATVGLDFVERMNSESSVVTFHPGEKENNCSLSIIDDSEFEGTEHFRLLLVDDLSESTKKARIGANRTVLIQLADPEDAIIVQLEKLFYAVERPISADHQISVKIDVVRSGDLQQVSHVRVSTKDGSAMSGVDYHAKSKLLTFALGESKKTFDVEVLFNKQRKWKLSFSVFLGPDEPENAALGNVTQATVTLSETQDSGNGILPAVPLVVSLQYYNDIDKGIATDPSPGYPLICVTPCDEHYPHYTSTGSLCNKFGINTTSLYFTWEIAMPLDNEATMSAFESVRDSTLFTSAHNKVLDSIYFSQRQRVRCVVQSRDSKGHLGIPLRSKEVKISPTNGICQTPLTAGHTHFSLQAPSFVSSLKYVNSSDKEHPNQLHIHIEIPHQDGMLPLISTHPLHNIRFLLTQPIYRQQHLCSNLIIETNGSEQDELIPNRGFLEKTDLEAFPEGSGYNRPFQFNDLRGKDTLTLYRYLNLKSCTWTFDAWYRMSELVDLCGGTVTSDFQVRDSHQSFVTVQLPLYVSYVFATAPTGWTSVEHRTEMEFSFIYNTVMWRTGLETEGTLTASLQVLRIGINKEGQLFFEFKTKSKFRGLFVMEHPTLPGFKSHVNPPENLDISFDLHLVWSEQTYDGPTQLWMAKSNYNLKDYTGQYAVELIPCRVSATQTFEEHSSVAPTPCIAYSSKRFDVPLAFQQTSRPVPVVYSLNTIFQLLNNEKMFSLNLFDSSESITDMDYKGAFLKGHTVYGRVLWSPEQDLESAYQLKITKVMICTGEDGYTPVYDPLGDTYGEGPQFGCIQSNTKIKYKFLILDRHNPEAVDKEFHDIPFKAKFAEELPQLEGLQQVSGMDGFLLKVDALYKVNSGFQWFIQVMYTIGPALRGNRERRSLEMSENHFSHSHHLTQSKLTKDIRNGTNIRSLLLERTMFEKLQHVKEKGNSIIYLLVSAVCVIVLLASALIVLRLKWKRPQHRNVCERQNRRNLRKQAHRSNAQRSNSGCEGKSSEKLSSETKFICGSSCRVKLSPLRTVTSFHKQIPPSDETEV